MSLKYIMGENQMNKKIILFIFVLFIVLGCACIRNENMDLEKEKKEFQERMIKKTDPYYFYNAIYRKDVDLVRSFLEAGANPNKCKGENGWVDSNPLKVVTESFYDTYDYRNQIPRVISGIAPDVAVIQLLVSAGADINRLPYVWDRVYRWSTEKYKKARGKKYNNLTADVKEQIEMDTYVRDANRVLAALLEAGANPDKLGHPYPFGYDWKIPFLNDRRANKYFSQGTRAINEAIEKGIIWESQVDLLLQYTVLDEESLKAAERSNDPAMIEKINTLWEKRRDDSH